MTIISAPVSDDKLEYVKAFFKALQIEFDISDGDFNSKDYVIPEWQKSLVRERVENSKDDDYVSWDEIKKEIGK